MVTCYPNIGVIKIANSFPNSYIRNTVTVTEEGIIMKDIQTGEAPIGYKWVKCRYRRKKNSEELLDANNYGYKCWCFLVRSSTK